MMFKNKEMVLYIYPDGTQKYVFVEKKENSDSEKSKQNEEPVMLMQWQELYLEIIDFFNIKKP